MFSLASRSDNWQGSRIRFLTPRWVRRSSAAPPADPTQGFLLRDHSDNTRVHFFPSRTASFFRKWWKEWNVQRPTVGVGACRPLGCLGSAGAESRYDISRSPFQQSIRTVGMTNPQIYHRYDNSTNLSAVSTTVLWELYGSQQLHTPAADAKL